MSLKPMNEVSVLSAKPLGIQLKIQRNSLKSCLQMYRPILVFLEMENEVIVKKRYIQL